MRKERMKRHLTMIVLAAASTFGCGGEKPAAAPPTPGGGATATAAAPAAPATATAGIPPAVATATGDIGIPECDDYLRKYEACVRDKVPASAKAQLEAALDQHRQAWKAAAAQPAARATLASTCQQSVAAARMSMSAYGCQW
jgi:hypothetical protein